MSINKSFGFWSHAKEFLSAAKVVKDPLQGNKGKNNFSLILPAYYLVGHSIELSLKSYLAAKGYKTEELRSKKYGHDLEALLIECRKKKLGREAKLSKHQVTAIKLFSNTYKSKKLEYLEYGNYRLPEYSFIYNVAKHLNDSLACYASNSPFNLSL
jgi:hypothetical protein